MHSNQTELPMGGASSSNIGGSIEVIVGSMFSGKTEELIRVLRRAKFARQQVQVFKPRIDNRYSVDHVASHDRSLLPSTVIETAAEIYTHLRPDTKVIGIDEGQFFDDELVDVAGELADRGLRVVIAGLDLNWKGEPFHPMPELMAIAETVKKLRAVCVVCGQAACRTQRLVKTEEQILVGDHTSYEARCRSCFEVDLAVSSTSLETQVNSIARPPALGLHSGLRPGSRTDPLNFSQV